MTPRKNYKKRKSSKGIQFGLIFLLLFSFISASFFYLLFLKSATSFEDDEITIYISSSNATPKNVKAKLKSNINPTAYTTFLALAQSTGYWKEIKPGRYIITKGSGVFNIFRRFKGGRQSPVTLTLNKFRTKKELSTYIGGKLECSTNSLLKFLNNRDSLKSFDLTPETALSIIIPNTYEIYWNTTPGEFFSRMKKESARFWDDDRLDQAKEVGLSPLEVYILAS
ncbi:MAG: endolytic transglycosylase MltG, partial [Bacteroidota bacterium]